MLEMGTFLKNAALMGAALALMAVPVPWPHGLDEAIRPGEHDTCAARATVRLGLSDNHPSMW